MAFRRPQFIIATTFVTNFWSGMLTVVIPAIAKERMGVSATMLGLYGSVPLLFYILGAITGGRLSDRRGRRSVMKWAILGTAVGVAGIGYALVTQKRYFLFFPLALQNMATGMFWPVVEAAIGDGQGVSQIRRATGFFNITWMTGAMLGAVVGGSLYSVGSEIALGLILSFLLSLILIASVWAMLFLPRALDITPWGREEADPAEANVSPERHALFVRLGFIGNMVSFFMLGSYRSLLPEYASSVEIGRWRYGLLQASVTAGMVVFNLILMNWRKWHYRISFFFGAELAAAVFLVSFALCDRYEALLALAFLIGGPVLVTYFSSIYYGLARFDRKGDHCGDHEAVLSLGLMLGPFLGSLAITWTSRFVGHAVPRAFMALSAGVYLLAILWQSVLVWRSRRRQSRT